MEKIQGVITDAKSSVARPLFPGIEAAFGILWSPRPALEIAIPDEELRQALHLDDRHIRVYRTVELYSRRIVEALKGEDITVDIWFVIIPDEVYQYGRPLSKVTADVRIHAEDRLSPQYARRLQTQASLFPEDSVLAQPYYYDVHFHNQLKARLLEHNLPTQIIRESTIAHHDFVDRFGNPIRNLGNSQSAIAWNLSTAAFYKAGGRPWKLSGVRKGVCYVGVAFKVDGKSQDPRSACLRRPDVPRFRRWRSFQGSRRALVQHEARRFSLVARSGPRCGFDGNRIIR